MSQQKKKPVYLTKEIFFGNHKLVLFSLDGATWSSRKSELLDIQERHEREKIKITDIKGGENEEEEKTETESEESSDEPFELVSDDEDSTEKRGKGKSGAKKGKLAVVAKTPTKKLPDHKAPKAVKAKSQQQPTPKRRVSSKPQQAKAKGKLKGKRAA